MEFHKDILLFVMFSNYILKFCIEFQQNLKKKKSRFHLFTTHLLKSFLRFVKINIVSKISNIIEFTCFFNFYVLFYVASDQTQ